MASGLSLLAGVPGPERPGVEIPDAGGGIGSVAVLTGVETASEVFALTGVETVSIVPSFISSGVSTLSLEDLRGGVSGTMSFVTEAPISSCSGTFDTIIGGASSFSLILSFIWTRKDSVKIQSTYD